MSPWLAQMRDALQGIADDPEGDDVARLVQEGLWAAPELERDLRQLVGTQEANGAAPEGGVIITTTKHRLHADIETQRISREGWGAFLDEFTEINEGPSCRVEVVGSPDLGTQILLDERPLRAVSLDEDEGAPQAVIECGDPADDGPAAFRRLVRAPTALWGRRRMPHGWDALEIESAEGGAVIVTIDPHPAR